MGVDLGNLAIRHPITLESLSGSIIAIDAFNMFYQFLASIRQEDGTLLMDSKGRITAHLSGLFYRTARTIENGIKPIFVFDGKAPPFKYKTSEQRAAIKKDAEEKWKKALAEERLKDARMFAQATSKLTEEMVQESKKLLEAMGMPYFDAPSEGEAQAAAFVKSGSAHASASQDYDALLFGSPVLVRNISITGKRKVPKQDRYVLVEPEKIKLEEVLSSLGIDQKKLVMIGLLVGTDYNEGIKGVGPKTALKIVKQVASLDDLRSYIKSKYNYEFENYITDVFSFFLEPPCKQTKVDFEWKIPNSEYIMKNLCDEHDFSLERVEKTIENMINALKEKGAQKKLDSWFD